MTRCDDCGKPVHLDPNGFWVGEDETSDCDEAEIGHRVNGVVWG